MNDKTNRPLPPSLAQFAVEQLAEAGDTTAIDLTVQNVEILRAEIVNRDARIESQARMIERIESERAEQWRIRRDAVADIDTKSAIIAELRAELSALKARPSAGVVLPERVVCEDGYPSDDAICANAWNACIDEVARLNPCRAQSVPYASDDYAAFEAFMEVNGAVSDPRAMQYMLWRQGRSTPPSQQKESGDE